MKIQELRRKNIEELRAVLINLLREKFSFYMQKNNREEPKKHHIIKNLRKTIARVKTLITEKQNKKT